MTAAPRPVPHRSLRSAHTVATVMPTLLLTVGTAACSTPAAGDDVPAPATTQDDPRFENTVRHECADVGGVGMHDVTGGGTPHRAHLH